MIILNGSEGHVNGTHDGIASAKAADLYAVVLYRDGSTEDVGSAFLAKRTDDYSVLFDYEEDPGAYPWPKYGRLQFTPTPDMDAILLSGQGYAAEEGEWLELEMSDGQISTKASNVLVVEFGEDGEYAVWAEEAHHSPYMASIKREAPTLWGRDSRGRLEVSWEPHSK